VKHRWGQSGRDGKNVEARRGAARCFFCFSALALTLGCASSGAIRDREFRNAVRHLEEIPNDKNIAERTDFYESHRVESVDKGRIEVNHVFYDRKSSEDYLDFYGGSEANRWIIRAQPRADSIYSHAWFVPMGTIGGALIGAGLGFLAGGAGAAFNDAPDSGVRGADLLGAWGAGTGLLSALVLWTTSDWEPNRSGGNAQKIFNRSLAHRLEIEISPGPGAGTIGTKLNF